jgi:LysM repeat protein
MKKKKPETKKNEKIQPDVADTPVVEDILAPMDEKESEKLEEPKKANKESKDAIVITETEDDIVLDSGFNGDPEGLKEEIKKEAAKSDVLYRFLIPLFTFIIIGLVAASLTWYYARPEVANQKTTEEKIENAPNVTEETPVETPSPATTPAVTPQTTTPAPVQPKTYTVQAGDTLSSIANANGLTSKQLADYNGITNADSLKIGQVLKIPAS